MKTNLIIFGAVCAFVANFEVLGLGQPNNAGSTNYVVIGAFAVKEHASIWVRNAKRHHFSAVSAKNRTRNLYYVYVLNTGDHEAAITEARKIRKDTPYWDTWVYSGALGDDMLLGGGTDFDPVTHAAIGTVTAHDETTPANSQFGPPVGGSKSSSVSPSTTGSSLTAGSSATTGTPSSTGLSSPGASSVTATGQPMSSGTTESAESQKAGAVAAGTSPAVLDPQTSTPDGSKAETNTDPGSSPASTTAVAGVSGSGIGPVADPEEGSRNFVFQIFAEKDHQELSGDVDVLDVDRGRKVASYLANQNVIVKPLNKSGNISFLCDVFGYRKMKVDINYNHPSETAGVVQQGNQTVVPFALARLQKGDFSVMYNVYFFKDAGVMRPESRTEVYSLLAMMKENPKYRIRIHGHTNGNAHGKIISMGESKKFFALVDTKEGFGSAKRLSEERAKVIREYLINEGIDPGRMEIKAWGGKRPVEDKMSVKAQSNVRVEIEILDDK